MDKIAHQKSIENPTFELIELNHEPKELFSEIFKKNPTNDSCMEINLEEIEQLNDEILLELLDVCEQRGIFITLFRSKNNNSFAYFWRLKGTKRFLLLQGEGDEIIVEFLKKFIEEAIRKNLSGLHISFESHTESRLIPIDLHTLRDDKNHNLLFIAASTGSANLVKYLINYGFNTSHLINGKTPADISYESSNFDALLEFLKANSKFPKNFDVKKVPERIEEFLKISQNLRDAIKEENFEKIREILKANENLKHFYDTSNSSVLTFTIINKKLNIYEELINNKIFFGAREDLDDIMDTLNEREQNKLRVIHLKNSKILTEKHLTILLANSSISGDDLKSHDRFDHVRKAFEFLNKIPSAKSILKVVAAKKDFEIHFDFNREDVRYLDPSTIGADGLFLTSGRILIAAKGLLDDEKRFEVYGVIIHEMCHFAVCLVYGNYAKPYRVNDVRTFNRLQDICSEAIKNQGYEPLISSVFQKYSSEVFHEELIVRPSQIIVNYHDDEEKLREICEKFPSLFDFFNNQIIPDVEEAIPRIENEAEKAYEKALEKISKMKKFIYVLMILLIFGAPILIWIFYAPTYSWSKLSDLDKIKILNTKVKYRGVEIQLDKLLSNNSEAFEFLSSKLIKNTLDGDLIELNKAINSNLDQYVYLSALNLTEEFREKILDSKFNFQGEIIQIPFLLNFNSHKIKEILNNEIISISKPTELDSFFIPRKFVDSSQIKNTSQIYELIKTDKIFLLADSPGSGKSFVFRHIASDFKKLHPKYWIEYIQLKDHIEVFKSVEGKELNISEISSLIATKMLKLESIESELFLNLFNDNKVALIWDAVDEISPTHNETFLEISLQILNKSENFQFISTRLQFVGNLEQSLDKTFYSLLPYTKNDRYEFIVKYLETQNVLKSEIKRIADNVEDFITGIIDDETKSLKDDINNPLMLCMLSEIATNNTLSKDLDNIYEIYDFFVKKKINYVDGKGSNVRNVTQNLNLDINTNEVHEIYALRSIMGGSFRDHLNKRSVNLSSLQIMQKEVLVSEYDVAHYGIMSLKTSNRVDFVHRTFAEFFVTKYLINNIYKASDNPRIEEMMNRIALLHNIAFELIVQKIIHKFILSFLKLENKKVFSNVVIEVFQNNFVANVDYFGIEASTPLFLRFFEKDERIMRILARVNKYENINKWLEVELGIELGNKSSFIENNQLGFILMRSWQFERNGNKVFADFIRKSTNLTENEIFKEISSEIANENSNQIANEIASEILSEFLNLTLKFLTNEEKREIFINSVYLISLDFLDESESEFFMNKFSETLKNPEIKIALTKIDSKNRNLPDRTIKINNKELNEKIFNLMEQTLNEDEIYGLLVKRHEIANSTLAMLVCENQDIYFLEFFIDFMRNHTTKDQFIEILLLRDKNQDTMLQYTQNFIYQDNFVFLALLYKDLIPLSEIQRTYTDRDEFALASFTQNVQTSTMEVLMSIEYFVDLIFANDSRKLVELLKRKNKNGDTIFSLNQGKKYKEKIEIFEELLKRHENNLRV